MKCVCQTIDISFIETMIALLQQLLRKAPEGLIANEPSERRRSDGEAAAE